MRRFRLPVRRTALLLGVTAFMAAAMLPLQVALSGLGLDTRGLSARAVSGSIWSGELSEAYFGTFPLGNPAARFVVWKLLLGEAQLALNGGEDGGFQGKITGYRNGFALDDIDARLPAGALGLPGEGAILLEDVDLRFENGLCVEAQGQAATDVLSSADGLGLPQISLSGVPRCEGAVAQLPLSGSASGMDARMTLTMNAGGTLTGTLDLVGAPDTIAPALTANGFAGVGDGAYRLTF